MIGFVNFLLLSIWYISLLLRYILKSMLWKRMELRLNIFSLVRDKKLPEIKRTEKRQQMQ